MADARYTLRSATVEDTSRVLSLAEWAWFDGYLEWPSRDHIESMFGPLREEIAASVAFDSEPPFVVLAVDAQDRIVGLFDAYDDEEAGPRVLRGNHAIVAPTHCEQGIASKLLEEVKLLGAAVGYNVMRVQPVTPIGVEVVAKWGFRDEISGGEPKYREFAVLNL